MILVALTTFSFCITVALASVNFILRRRLARQHERANYHAHIAEILRGQLAAERTRSRSLLEANCTIAQANQQLQDQLRAVQRVAFGYFLFLN
ncbi:MAG: hypothetical protein ACOH2M_21520 [Cypionkella sp.]